jgi:hypothetical protein
VAQLAAFHGPSAVRVPRRDRHQHGPALWPQSRQRPPGRSGAAWALAHHHLRRRPIGGGSCDAASAPTQPSPRREVYEFLEAERFLCAIRLPNDPVLQARITHLLTRPGGRPPHHVRRYYASFSYQAGSWNTKRRVVAKVKWHPGELCPRIGYIVTNMARPAERVAAFYNQRGTAEQHIKEGKNAVNWTRLSCRTFRNNAVRLQLHALAYNLANFMRTLALPEEVEHWSLTTLREKLVKIGARIVRQGRYVVFQLAEVAVPRALSAGILRRIDELRPRPPPLLYEDRTDERRQTRR